MRNLPNADQQLDAVFDAFPDLLFILDNDGRIVGYKTGDPGLLYTTPDNFMGRRMQDVLPAEAGGKFDRALFECRKTSEAVTLNYSLRLLDHEKNFEARLTPSLNSNIIVVARDITRYKQAENRVQNQLRQLAALHSIDQAITSGLELNLVLSMLLSHVTAHLQVDAASVLLLDRGTQTLEYSAGLGFRTDALQHTHLRLGEGSAGQAALERRAVNLQDAGARIPGFDRSPLFYKEGFIVYFAVPLIAKGQIQGVLEVFHRSPLDPDSDWQNFLNILAGQAAIAVDNSMMFRELQRSNAELKLAYDSIIDGWSRTLDLRDKETQGHTRRVTEITVNLANRMKVSDTEIVHIRRGAILHDIGKVAIPDQILFKPGPLTQDEWEIMRRHPSIAVELLSPISHLAPALDIPRFHHEKWNGTGYPNGLHRQQIPLAARLFAVVDVYDALTSDRPYRPAWKKQEAIDYIKEQSGMHFDPDIIPPFLEIISKSNGSSYAH